MEKLFWQDPYMKECKAVVKWLDGRSLTLDKTILFAFSGGQASDKGSIGGIPIVEDAESINDIVYVLESDPTFKEGDEVDVVLDWEHRYRIMRLHTAAHIVFEIFRGLAGNKKIIGSNITVEKARIDFEMSEPVSEFLEQTKVKVDEIIAQDVEVKCYDNPEKEGRRVWEIPGKWKMPCGGTHVKKTGEIGKILLKRKNIGAGKERIEIILEDENEQTSN